MLNIGDLVKVRKPVEYKSQFQIVGLQEEDNETFYNVKDIVTGEDLDGSFLESDLELVEAKSYYIVQVLEKGKEEVEALIEQRFELHELEEVLRRVSMMKKCFDTDRCFIEVVKWVNDMENKVVLSI